MSARRPAPVKTWHSDAYPAISSERPELSARGKTVVVTGGGTGIGAETVRQFARAGAATIAILGRRQRPLEECRLAVSSDFPHTKILTVVADVTREADVERAFSQLFSITKIDILVLNAAILGHVSDVADANVDQWLADFNLNVKVVVVPTLAFLRYAASNAIILNVSTCIAHIDLMPNMSSYTSSKAATQRFLRAVHFEHTELRIHHLHPGAIRTEANANVKVALPDSPSLPASTLVWLASTEAAFLNGKFIWANWDVEELQERAAEIESTSLLEIGLIGWPFA